MADQEAEDFRMALRMSMQHSAPEPKRSKPLEVAGATEESPEAKNRKSQRELMAAAAEKRMMEASRNAPAPPAAAAGSASGSISRVGGSVAIAFEKQATGCGGEQERGKDGVGCMAEDGSFGKQLSVAETNDLFSMMFGSQVTKEILAQWSNQGIRFSPDPETSMGLVQHEGGPCGVLAAIQAYVLKYLLFSEELSSSRRCPKSQNVMSNNFASLSESGKLRALIRSMAEILFLCGNNKRAIVATLSVLDVEGAHSGDGAKDEIIAKCLEGLSIESAADIHKILRINTYDSLETTLQRLETMLPVFQSRMGAMLFLISALLSRGMDKVQADRDDPSQPLVTAPFGHASQEIVNLLLCGNAVPNVFDGRMDLGGGLFLKGIPTSVEVGFLSLLESLNLCKVGEHLKCPKWPIWVVGSDSHYTVIFAFDITVQEENELEERESQIRKAFDAQDQSGGGGFISVEGFDQVLGETKINLPPEKLAQLRNAGFIVWSEFWQVLLDVDKSLGGLKDSTGLMGKKMFDLYHFNGIAKSVSNGSQMTAGGDAPVQRPRLTKLRVSVPPRWTPEEYMTVPGSSAGKDTVEVSKPEPSQHAPLADCIRTRWPRAICSWDGDAPSIV